MWVTTAIRKFFRPIPCCVVIIAVSSTLFNAAPSVQASDSKPISVTGDDSKDTYTGTGGLLLPKTFTGTPEQKTSVSNCLDCRWSYRLQCASDLHDMCMQAAMSCPASTIRYAVWFQRAGEESQQIGSVCWGKTIPATRTTVTKEINQQALRHVPDLNIGSIPRRDSIQGIPNYFGTGQPRNYVPPAMMLSGLKVHIRAQPIWRWVWGDGSSQWVRTPGNLSTASPVSHTFTRAGIYQISVTTVWQATFSIDGFGTYPVTGPVIRQSDALTLHVHRQHVALSGI